MNYPIKEEIFRFKEYSDVRHDFILETMENMRRAEKLGEGRS